MNIGIQERIFCENMKQLRKIKGLSKKEMAKKLGIGIPSLTKIENGIMPPRLSCEIILKIWENFGMTTKDMFTPSFFEHKADR